MSLNPAHGEVYLIQHYVINFCQLHAAGQWFSQETQLSPTNKTDCHDIDEIFVEIGIKHNDPNPI